MAVCAGKRRPVARGRHHRLMDAAAQSKTASPHPPKRLPKQSTRCRCTTIAALTRPPLSHGGISRAVAATRSLLINRSANAAGWDCTCSGDLRPPPYFASGSAWRAWCNCRLCRGFRSLQTAACSSTVGRCDLRRLSRQRWSERKWALAGTFQSPLTDSNRRPPPYHPGSPATGCKYRRLVARNRAAFEPVVVALICGGLRPLCSTNAPYRPALVVEVDHFLCREGVERD
jgi:hypothetical protein